MLPTVGARDWRILYVRCMVGGCGGWYQGRMVCDFRSVRTTSFQKGMGTCGGISQNRGTVTIRGPPLFLSVCGR